VLFGEELSVRLFERAADAAVQGAEPLRRNSYKLPLLRGLIKRALQALII
jgi:CO/xanthine dehydrogenase FAD-binding subunit